MNTGECYFIGLDIHKRIIVYCVKNYAGALIERGSIAARRADLLEWTRSLSNPWIAAMEATLFTGWIYDLLKPYAMELKVADPQRLKAISEAKKKSDMIDAEMLCDLTRVGLLPECYMAPRWSRDLRRVLRFRNFLVRLSTTLKNKNAGLLMECGVEYVKSKLHGKRYFQNLLGNLSDTAETIVPLLRFNHDMMCSFNATQRHLLRQLQHTEALAERVKLLQTIPAVGEVLGLTWALEVGEPSRFGATRKAISYCGLCSRLIQSANKTKRGPLSKKRNEHLQWVLIEVAKLAPNHNPQLAAVRDRVIARGGNRNQATLAVARKLVAYLLSVDRSGKPFVARENDYEEKGDA